MTAMAGVPISYAQHRAYIEAALAAGEIFTDKSTHAPRVYGAQLLIDMGVDMELVQRAGGWKQDTCGTAYFCAALGPQALLALGMWRVVGTDYGSAFYDDRMVPAIPEDLVYHVMPSLCAFCEAAEAASKAAAAGDKSMRAAAGCLATAKVMRMALVVAIQDAVVLADTYPDNLLIRDLKGHAMFE